MSFGNCRREPAGAVSEHLEHADAEQDRAAKSELTPQSLEEEGNELG